MGTGLAEYLPPVDELIDSDEIDWSNITMEQLIKICQSKYLVSRIDSLPEDFVVPLLSQWAEENRYIPEGISDFPGMFDPEFAPQWIEPLDKLHPDDPARIITVMKSDQSMCTTSVAENAIGAYIRHQLGSILYLTSTKEMGKIRGSANLDTLIDYSGLADYIKPMSSRNKRKQKDNELYKELAGNNILMVTSYGSSAGMKSTKYNLIIKDELDEAGVEIAGLGDIEKVIETRTYGASFYKILNISTASRAETSRINKNFYKGDQREYECMCPHCGYHQELILKRRGQKHGLTFKKERDSATGMNRLVPGTIRYICAKCGKEALESDHSYMLRNGMWVPRVKNPADPNHFSYRSPGMLSQPLTWKRVCQLFADTDFGEDIQLFKNFTINILAKAWVSVKKTAKWESLKARAEDYILGQVPKGEVKDFEGRKIYYGPLLLSGGADIHKDRIELAVVGFGFNGEKWILDHKVFHGNTANIADPCWAAFSDFVYNHSYEICGEDVVISMCAVDAGYDPRKSEKRDKDYNDKAHIVYEFVAAHDEKETNRFMAILGSPDEKALGIIKESRVNDMKTTLTKRYIVNVNQIKDMIFNVIEKSEGHNAIHVPSLQLSESGLKKNLPDWFYQQILSERYQENPKKAGKYGWFKIRERNELLDCLVYAIAASEFNNVSMWGPDVWADYYYDLTAI